MSPRLRHLVSNVACAIVCLGLSVTVYAQTPAGTYAFRQNLAADQLGLPALDGITGGDGSSDGSAGFLNTSVSYNEVYNPEWTIYYMEGAPGVGQNTGLRLDALDVLANGSNYTFEMVFRFNEDGVNRKIIDATGLNFDDGLYVDANNHLLVKTLTDTITGGATLLTGQYYHLTVTYGDSVFKAYIDGQLQFSTVSSALTIPGEGGQIYFFVDDMVTDGMEYGDADVALIRLYSTPITSGEASSLASSKLPVVVPESGTLALFVLPLMVLGGMTYRRYARSRA